jgi:hypothetical protein
MFYFSAEAASLSCAFDTKISAKDSTILLKSTNFCWIAFGIVNTRVISFWGTSAENLESIFSPKLIKILIKTCLRIFYF